MRKRSVDDRVKPGHDSIQAWSAAEIADRWGALKRRAGKVADEIDELKAEFERRGLLSAKGLKFTVVKSVRAFSGLDVKAIRAEMGPEWCAEREKPGERTAYEVNPL